MRIKKYQCLRKYGITLEEKEFMVDSQGGSCAICGCDFSGEVKPNIDHCHATGKVRGILCRKCNSVLGLADDDAHRLGVAISYLLYWQYKHNLGKPHRAGE